MTATAFLDKLNSKVASKRASQQELAKALGQSPTETESDWLHGINITRFAEMYKGKPQLSQELGRRVAWQIATEEQRGEIVQALRKEAGIEYNFAGKG